MNNLIQLAGLDRHNLVWIRPERRASVAGQISDNATRNEVVAWLAADCPLVVARQPCDAILPDPTKDDRLAAGTIAVGLALPPDPFKRRIALRVAARDIVRCEPPMLLADTLSHAPPEWQSALGELDAAAADIGIKLRVFGSLAWQALSGLRYLNPQSDIDLLWHPGSKPQFQQGMALLQRWEQSSGLRADGEVLFGAGNAVSWREWTRLASSDVRRVLVKRLRSAELVDAVELQDMLA